MERVKTGIIAGLAFGLLDVLIMIPLDLPEKNTALLGAFIGRFAIGFLIPNTVLPVPAWLRGLIIGLLISLPDAIISKAYGPVMGTGAIGGVIIGFIVGRRSKNSS